MLYTYIRRRKTVEVGIAANAAPPSYNEKERSVSWELEGGKKVSSASSMTSQSSAEEGSDSTSRVSCPVAAFPQYVAKESTTLLMKEDLIPYLPGSFTVWQGNQRVFEIDRERPSMTHRTNIIDAQSREKVIAVRKNIYNVPISFTFEDPDSKKVVDLQGEFFVPYSGAKSTANMVNAETGSKTTLTMKGSYMNRHAVVKNEAGEVLARMTSNVFEARNLVGHRRTYEVTIRPGADVALMIAMIVALHEREQHHRV